MSRPEIDSYAFMDYLDNHFNIVQVSGGKQVKLEDGACPFCGEDRSDLRMYINSETGIGQCFHCEKGFNAISFVKANEGCSVGKAIKILVGDEDAWARTEEEEEISEEGLKFPRMVKASDSEQGMAYLVSRDIDERLATHFGLHYAVENVTIQKKLYYVKDRIIIPIYDIEGGVVSWQGRDTTGKSKQKYLFPPDFQGRNHLYNAQAVSRRPDYCILSEGAFDVWGWWRSGFENCVGSFGKKLSEGQLDIMRYINPKILYVAWDSDADWLKYELIEKIGHMFDDIRIVDLGGKDADELKKEALTERISRATCYDWGAKILGSL